MDQKTHLLLATPKDWTQDRKGEFYENLIAELLEPMRYSVVKRIRFTGMEIDLLAKAQDHPSTILVECKAQRDPLSADSITKLMGNVEIRKADAGWLFSASELNKEGKGLWEDIKNDSELSRKFVWYSPEKITKVFLSQHSIVNPTTLSHYLSGYSVGDWTLIISPSNRSWLAQIIEDGIPTRFAVFDAKDGVPWNAQKAKEITNILARFDSLTPLEISERGNETQFKKIERAPIAKVISGDAWDDPRPARPADFVGRDDIIEDIRVFVDNARANRTLTRTFAILSPSGWGKSSLVLKLVDLAAKNKLIKCSLTAVDTRSATNSAFVTEALRTAFLDAAQGSFLPPQSSFNIDSLRDPLDSDDVINGLRSLQDNNSCIVLIFDQFEELFSKEDLFETFNAVRELALDIDARQVPIILGFAWKTDISLPQQHPAYHLWHELSDRRRTFKLREFGTSDIRKIITRSERASKKKLSPALRARLVEQCQHLPWLLKKLLIHVLNRISTAESQYLFLERELDVELLFKEDLSVLGEDHLRCLSYVASRAPIAVAEVEENFSRITTNFLINAHLLVRSGMNYVVYWDIFRDYLVEKRVPNIPWARTFQRGPTIALKALRTLSELGQSNASVLAKALELKEGPCLNLLGDLVALQLVDTRDGNAYAPASHLKDLKPITIAKCVKGQLERHVVVRQLTSTWEREKVFDVESWPKFFAEAHPRTSIFSQKTIYQYARNFRNWLLFAGILEQRNKYILRPIGDGRQMGMFKVDAMVSGKFLGTASPRGLEKLLSQLKSSGDAPVRRADLEKEGLRNAISDAISLGLVVSAGGGYVKLRNYDPTINEIINEAKIEVLKQETIRVIEDSENTGNVDIRSVGYALQKAIGATWKETSVSRYTMGLRRYFRWAKNNVNTRQDNLWGRD